jgi:hypothetical protein
MQKWHSKFDRAIKERADFKRRHYIGLELDPVTVNTNLENPSSLYEPRPFQTSMGYLSGNQISPNTTRNFSTTNEKVGKSVNLPGQGEYKRVMERRKSRHSTRAPVNVDLDYAGDSAKFEHILRHHEYTQGVPNTSILNFGMRLRTYKAPVDEKASFLAPQPW